LADVLLGRALHTAREAGDDRLRRDLPLADRDVQRLEARELHLVRELLERVLAPLATEPLPDLVAGARRLDPSEPVLRRSLALRLRGQDVDRIARSQFVVERNELAVHLGADGPVPDLGMDR